MSHELAHATNKPHGFIQMHLAGTPTAALAQQAATAVNNQKTSLPGVQNASPADGTVLVYVEFPAGPARWDPKTGAHDPVNDTTPAHDRVVVLRQLIARNVSKPDTTPFFDFGLSHNWCCYGDS